MATMAPAVGQPTFWRRLTFWQRLTGGIALFIVFGFLQFAARGRVDVRHTPFYVHAHGVVMVAWLAVTVTQSFLAERRDRVLHRRLGWTGTGLAALVFVFAGFMALHAVATRSSPFFITPALFLWSNIFGLLVFAGTMIAAIVLRRRTQWHQRLVVAAMVPILGPALGRTLPGPLLTPYAMLAMLPFQLLVPGILARHDKRVLGSVRPATIVCALTTVGTHLLAEIVARTPAGIGLAAHLAGR